MENKKTGLFFGSFNPVHNGHLSIARFLLDNEGLNEIWFVVSPQNPLKEKGQLENPQHRLEMMKLAIESLPGFKICDVEFSMPKPSYTFDTLKLLTQKHPERKFFLIAGSDSLNEFHFWKNYKMILENYEILIYPRSNKSSNPFASHPNVKQTAAPLIKISSTYIRQCLHDKTNVQHIIPETVYNYIVSKGLYGM